MMVAQQIGGILHHLRSRGSNNKSIPAYRLKDPFRFKILNVLFPKSNNHVKCSISIFHAGLQFGKTITTDKYPTQLKGLSLRRCEMNQWVDFADVTVRNLPLATRIIFQLYSTNNHPLGWCGMTVFNFERELKTGLIQMHIWDGACPSPLTSALENMHPEASEHILSIEMRTFESTVIYEVDAKTKAAAGVPVLPSSAFVNKDLDWYISRMTPQERARFTSFAKENPTSFTLTESDKQLIWRTRSAMLVDPNYLPIFLLCVDWFNAEEVAEAYRLIYVWASPTYSIALLLLDGHFANPKIRAYAVQNLREITDAELLDMLLPLVQNLRYEPFLDCALSRFLMRRALDKPSTVGHEFFWYLRGEMHQPEVRYRDGIFLNLYLRVCGVSNRAALGREMLVMRRLEDIANEVHKAQSQSKEERLFILRSMLERADFPTNFQLPLSSSLRAEKFIVSECSVVEASLKKAMRLVALNGVDGKRVVISYKMNTDVRQDQLAQLLISTMDRLWKQEGLDLAVVTYGCIALSDSAGLVELVNNSRSFSALASTTASVTGTTITPPGTKFLGASRNSTCAFPDDIIENWMHIVNVDPFRSMKRDVSGLLDKTGKPRSRRRFALSSPCRPPPVTGSDSLLPVPTNWRDVFARSLAGFCVASIVHGIVDRTIDHFMFKRTGELFLIDTNILRIGSSAVVASSSSSSSAAAAVKVGWGSGNPGKLTPQLPISFLPAFSFILGPVYGPTYALFETSAINGFLITRRNAAFLLSICSVGIANCEVPEAAYHDSMLQLRDNLMLDLDDATASSKFRNILARDLKAHSATSATPTYPAPEII